MKTLLKIEYDEDAKVLVKELSKNVEYMPLLLEAFHSLQHESCTFLAVVCSAFELICEEHPSLFDYLKKQLEKEEKPQAVIHVTPNPTKS